MKIIVAFLSVLMFLSASPTDAACQRIGGNPCYNPDRPNGHRLYSFPVKFADYANRYAGGIDEQLSRRCQQGRFGQRMNLRYYAVFRDGVAGIAFGTGQNLYDPGRLARQSRMYFIRLSPSSGICRVFTMPNDIRRNDDAGRPSTMHYRNLR